MQPGGAADMSALLQQAQRMQEQLMAAQAQIAAAEVSGESGGGLVRITGKGTGEVTSVRIDPKVVDPQDLDTLQDLIVGAFTDLMAKTQDLAKDRLGPLASGLGDLGGGMGLPGV